MPRVSTLHASDMLMDDDSKILEELRERPRGGYEVLGEGVYGGRYVTQAETISSQSVKEK